MDIRIYDGSTPVPGPQTGMQGQFECRDCGTRFLLPLMVDGLQETLHNVELHLSFSWAGCPQCRTVAPPYYHKVSTVTPPPG